MQKKSLLLIKRCHLLLMNQRWLTNQPQPPLKTLKLN